MQYLVTRSKYNPEVVGVESFVVIHHDLSGLLPREAPDGRLEGEIAGPDDRDVDHSRLLLNGHFGHLELHCGYYGGKSTRCALISEVL